MKASSKERAIGVFDSGIGGLTVVREISRLMPDEPIVYLGDTARLPFGSKSPVTIQRYSLQIARFLLQHDLKALVIACNTASAWALQQVAAYSPVPVLGVINAGCAVAADTTSNCRIGIIGTNATIRSGAYPAGIRRIMPEALIRVAATPLLVPLVEEGWLDHPITEKVVEEYCQELKDAKVDTLVLGCTHYPLLRAPLQRFFGNDVSLICSSEALAQELNLLLEKRGEKNESSVSRENRFYLTDYSETMHAVVKLFLNDSVAELEEVDITDIQNSRL
jgi:glutamate racemase